MKYFLVLMMTAFYSSNGFCHARLLPGGNTPPRSGDTNLKTGPCGGIPKTTPVASFNSGQTITLQWEETINHPGYFDFFISSDNDQTFTHLKRVEDDQNNRETLPHRYETTLELPTGLICDNCTIQMIQQMTENPSNPRPYFSCSDIEIKNSGTDTPVKPIDEDKNTVTDTPSDDCH